MNHDPMHTMTREELATFVNDFLASVDGLPGDDHETTMRLLALLIGRLVVFSFEDRKQRQRLAQAFTQELLGVVANDGYGPRVRRH